MSWPVIAVLTTVLAAGIGAMIITMIVGAVRSTRGHSDWNHDADSDFLPWNDDND